MTSVEDDLSEERTGERSRRGTSALAVDLRRARAARRRQETAAEGTAPPRAKPTRPSPTIVCGHRDPLDCIRDWFASEGWEPFPFQEEVWRAYLAGESGLIHAATGTGKTYAAWIGPVLEWLRDYPESAGAPAVRRGNAPPLRVLWVTPLRALAADTEAALR